jgi:hypothetical protein
VVDAVKTSLIGLSDLAVLPDHMVGVDHLDEAYRWLRPSGAAKTPSRCAGCTGATEVMWSLRLVRQQDWPVTLRVSGRASVRSVARPADRKPVTGCLLAVASDSYATTACGCGPFLVRGVMATGRCGHTLQRRRRTGKAVHTLVECTAARFEHHQVDL